MSRCFALIPAAGIGARTGRTLPKQYLPIAGKPMIVHAIEAFAAVAAIERIAIVVAPDDRHLTDLPLDRRVDVLRVGGASRDRSVANGLAALRSTVDDDDWVLIHDAARCGITAAAIESLIAAVGEAASEAANAVGGLLALPLDDTVKRAATGSTMVETTVDRRDLWRAQTPQMFRYRVLCDALAHAHASGLAVTDESSAVEAAGHRPLLVAGSPRNFKVTTAADLAMMDLLLRSPPTQPPTHRPPSR